MTGKCGDREYSIKMFCVLARDRKAVLLGTGGKVWEEARKASGLGKWLNVSHEKDEESEQISSFQLEKLGKTNRIEGCLRGWKVMSLFLHILSLKCPWDSLVRTRQLGILAWSPKERARLAIDLRGRRRIYQLDFHCTKVPYIYQFLKLQNKECFNFIFLSYFNIISPRVKFYTKNKGVCIFYHSVPLSE